MAEYIERLQYALECVVWYDGHEEWLENFADELENTTGYYKCPFDSKDWHSEEHTIYMLLVGMFGDWGTSIRGGWIEKTKECAEYIKMLCKNAKGETDGEEDDR